MDERTTRNKEGGEKKGAGETEKQITRGMHSRSQRANIGNKLEVAGSELREREKNIERN